MSKVELAFGVLVLYLFFRLFKEIAYIKLYAFIIKLKSEGKLIPENDPKRIAEKIEQDLSNNSSRWI